MDGQESLGSELGLNLVADDVDAGAADANGLGSGVEDGDLEIDWDKLFFHDVDRCLSPGFFVSDLLDLQSPPSPEILEHQLQPPSQLLAHSLPSSVSSSPNSLISSFSMEDFQLQEINHPNSHTSMEKLTDLQSSSPNSLISSFSMEDFQLQETNHPNSNTSMEKLTDPHTQNFQGVRAPTVEDAHNPVSRKRIRQMRNRDAAVRSRERRKMYITDLETKSRYLEGECRRLYRLLQCCYAENSALRVTLHSGNAYGGPMAKQESAVLLMESLLLGSLLWFLGIVCLLILPTIPALILAAAQLENLEGLERVSPSLIRGRSEILAYWVPQSFVLSRKYRASRTKLKSCLIVT